MGVVTFGWRRKGPGAAALHDARELRSRYGANAEQWCEIALRGRLDDGKRRMLEQIRLALKDVPPA